MPTPQEVRFEATVHILVPRDTEVSAVQLTEFLDGIETQVEELGGETTITMARSTKSDAFLPKRVPESPGGQFL